MNLLKTTRRYQEEMLAGILTLFFQFALIFQVIILTIVHTVYNPDPKTIHTYLAQIGIRIHLAIIPYKLCFIVFYILFKWYNLEEKKKLLIKARMWVLKL